MPKIFNIIFYLWSRISKFLKNTYVVQLFILGRNYISSIISQSIVSNSLFLRITCVPTDIMPSKFSLAYVIVNVFTNSKHYNDSTYRSVIATYGPYKSAYGHSESPVKFLLEFLFVVE